MLLIIYSDENLNCQIEGYIRDKHCRQRINVISILKYITNLKSKFTYTTEEMEYCKKLYNRLEILIKPYLMQHLLTGEYT